jgi:hypothetical protein
MSYIGLSFYIGKYWKSLPREERQVWETKAIMALADHRKKYPDWRFRTSTNVLAKVKDGPKRKSNKKARGEVGKKFKDKEKSLRCDKIADLLAAGKTGLDLEAAIQKYDHENEDQLKVKEEGCTVFAMKSQESLPATKSDSLPGLDCKDHLQFFDAQPSQCPAINLSESPSWSQASSDTRFCTPLTSMFRRSSSAPATDVRIPVGEIAPPGLPYLGRRESFSLPFPNDVQRTASLPPLLGHEVATRVERKADAMLNVEAMRSEEHRLTPQQPSSLPALTPPQTTNASWSDVSHAFKSLTTETIN